jgi:DNA gyrase subunit A
VSERGVIVRMRADAIPQQSRAATGVRLQRLDAGDRLAEVVLVPQAPEGSDEEPGSENSGFGDPGGEASAAAASPGDDPAAIDGGDAEEAEGVDDDV